MLELPFVACLIALAGIDLDHRLLPNRIVYPMAAYGLVATAIVDSGDLVEHLVAGAGAFLFLFVAALAYPRGMGMGDVKLAGAMGLYLGLSIVPAMLVAFLSGSVVGLGIIAREGAAAARRRCPSGCSSRSAGSSACSPARSSSSSTRTASLAERPSGWTFVQSG